MYITDAANGEAIGAAHGEFFSEIRPASTMVVVGGLLDPRWHIEMELEALVADPGVE
jgi:enamine deaminase RidA (YjgF/YER057c/UK114 family)